MDYFTKRRLVIWGFVILILINLAALGTIGYFRFFNPPAKIVYKHHYKQKDCIWDDRSFTHKQQAEIKEIRTGFINRSKIIIDSLGHIRVEIIHELSNADPDTLLLYELADKMGTLHADLKKVTIAHLLELKKTCTPEQHQKLIGHYYDRFEKRGYGRFMPGPDDKNREYRGKQGKERHRKCQPDRDSLN